MRRLLFVAHRKQRARLVINSVFEAYSAMVLMLDDGTMMTPATVIASSCHLVCPFAFGLLVLLSLPSSSILPLASCACTRMRFAICRAGMISCRAGWPAGAISVT